MITWTGQQIPDPEATGGVYIVAMVGNKRVSVFVSAEALEDYGLPACQDVAEEKIETALRAGRAPDGIRVLTSDFRSG